MFSHLKSRVKTEKRSNNSTALPMPFELPINYPVVVEEALQKGTVNGQAFTKLILSISSAIFRYKSYPSKAEYHHVVNQIMDKYPFIVSQDKKRSGDNFVSEHVHVIASLNFKVQDFLEASLRDKMKYLRNAKPRPRVKHDLTVDEESLPVKKKPFKPQYPSYSMSPEQSAPAAEDEASHLKHVKKLQLEERKVSPDRNVVADLMNRTFHLRRCEILKQPQLIQQLLKTYPSMKRCDQVCSYSLQSHFDLKCPLT